jgi:hypothetical protein
MRHTRHPRTAGALQGCPLLFECAVHLGAADRNGWADVIGTGGRIIPEYASFSSGMPMPVPVTLNTNQSLASRDSRCAYRAMVPFSVNLAALEIRLKRFWRTLVKSLFMPPSTTISTRSARSTHATISRPTEPLFSPSGAKFVRHKGQPHCPCRDQFSSV